MATGFHIISKSVVFAVCLMIGMISDETSGQDQFALRLANGGGSSHAGRVEVFSDGEWGTVCDRDWTYADAKVVCYQMDFGGPIAALGSAQFGPGTGTIVLKNLTCYGWEFKLYDCPSTDNTSCDHGDDVGVICSSKSTDQPTPYTVRLVDNNSSFTDGRVEVYLDGAWGTICSDSWDDTAATLVCQRLGYFYQGTGSATSMAPVSNHAPVIYDLSCAESDTYLSECAMTMTPRDCGTGDAAVTCTGSIISQPDDFEARLVDRPNLTQGQPEHSSYLAGIVEVFVNGAWKGICSNRVRMEIASVVCRQMGYGLAIATSQATIGSQAPKISLACSESYRSLQDCYLLRDPYTCDSSGTGDREVICSGSDQPQFILLLADGSIYLEGRVEIYAGGEWGKICSESFDTQDAEVVCRQLGYGGTPFVRTFGSAPEKAIFSLFSCGGGEPYLNDCLSIPLGNCKYDPGAGVACSNVHQVGGDTDMTGTVKVYNNTPSVEDYTVRLSDGELAYEGRVELYFGGQWYTVCADGWGTVESLVVCRQLGYAGASIYDRALTYGNGTSRPIGGLKCYGDDDLSDCVISWEGCASSKEAAIECCSRDYPIVLGSIRLLTGSSETQGRIEVFNDFEWGTICDEGWSDEDATVVCRELGFTNHTGKAVKGGYFGPGYNTVFLSNVRCDGNEMRLVYCDHDGWRNNDCDHTRDAGVICTLSGLDKPGDDNGGSGGLSAGAIAGICLGSVAVLAGILIVVGLIVYRKKNSSKSTFNAQVKFSGVAKDEY